MAKFTHIETHQGDYLPVSTFQSIRKIPGRGVVIHDAQNKICAFLEDTDPAVISQFCDIYKELIGARVALQQPDWSFISAAKAPVKLIAKA